MKQQARAALCAGLLIVGALAADSYAVRGPVSGYVLDGRSRSLRPVNGIPGGAVLGEPLRLGFAIGLAAVSVEKDYALVIGTRHAAAALVLKGLASGHPLAVRLEGAIAPTAFDLSSMGNTALLWSTRSKELQVITGLPDQPQVFPPIDVSRWMDTIETATISRNGTTLLAASSDGGIYCFEAQERSLSEPKWVARVPGAHALAFLGTSLAVAGSSTSGDVFLFRDLGSTPQVFKIASSLDGIESVGALRAVGEKTVCLVDASTGKAGILDIDNPTMDWLAEGANRCDRLNASMMALNEPGTQPFLLLDLTDGAKVFFVPAQ
jgi:hypothetical protein